MGKPRVVLQSLAWDNQKSIDFQEESTAEPIDDDEGTHST